VVAAHTGAQINPGKELDFMDRISLLSLHSYNTYANTLTLDCAKKMSEEELLRESSPSHGSVHALLTHMLLVEFFFLARSEGKPITPKDNPATTLPLDEIVSSFAQVAVERGRYLNWVTDEKLAEVITVPIGRKEYKLARWQLLAQSLLHSAHHRGELSIVMTSLGYPLPTLDPILQYVTESGQTWG
jgi:uncharacterized damage-inducible protein DinB